MNVDSPTQAWPTIVGSKVPGPMRFTDPSAQRTRPSAIGSGASQTSQTLGSPVSESLVSVSAPLVSLPVVSAESLVSDGPIVVSASPELESESVADSSSRALGAQAQLSR